MSGAWSFISDYYCHAFFTLLARRGLSMLEQTLHQYIARSEPGQASADLVRLVYISRHISALLYFLIVATLALLVVM